MMSKFIFDRDVVLSIGLLFFAASFTAEGIGEGVPIWRFVQGMFVGISIGAFALAIVLGASRKRVESK
jgi:hypothetical protein